MHPDHLSPSQGEDKHIFRMTPSKKKVLKPKQVSLDPCIKAETATIRHPNDENKLFDEEDDVGTSAIPNLSLPSEDEEEEVNSNNVCNMLLMSYSNSPHSILKGKASENGSSIKIWKL